MLSGCAQYRWQKPGMTVNEFERDKYECQSDAANMYPPAFVTTKISPDYVTPSTTNCVGSGNMTSCTTIPGKFVQGTKITSDSNTYAREQSASQCLRARGYELVRIEQ